VPFVSVQTAFCECTNRIATGHCEEREARSGNLYKTRNAPRRAVKKNPRGETFLKKLPPAPPFKNFQQPLKNSPPSEGCRRKAAGRLRLLSRFVLPFNFATSLMTCRVAIGHCEEREARRGNLYRTRNTPRRAVKKNPRGGNFLKKVSPPRPLSKTFNNL
jgi:hypothetical protein